jgi:hypothetical protein
MTEKRFKKLVLKLGAIVSEADPESAMKGLTIVAGAFGCLLDIYAKPNPENPQGMSNDPRAFRRHFADIIAESVAVVTGDVHKGKSEAREKP